MTERDILALTYHDLADITRRSYVSNPDTAQMTPSDVPVAEGVACALSQKSSGSLTVVESAGQTQSSYTLFCDPSADIKAGDRLKITTSLGQSFILFAGRPFVYVSHAEIPLTEEKRT